MAEMTIQNALDEAIAHHQSGRLQEAEHLYRQILAQQPNHADVLHRLGVLAGQVNRHDIALDLIRRAAALQPTFPPVHYSLANALRNNNQLDQAIASYEQAIKLDPSFVDAHNNLGNALRDKGKLDDAIVCYRKALALAPGYAAAQINLGDTLRLADKIPEAITCLERAVALAPGNPAAHCLLGTALHDGERIDEALQQYREALAIAPDYLDAINNLASALRKKGQLDESIAHYRRAVALNPQFAEAHNNLGGALQDAGQIEEAITCLRRATAINPNYADAYSNLGGVLLDKGAIDEAVIVCKRAAVLNPDLAEAQGNLGRASADSGRLGEAIDYFREAVARDPKLVSAHSTMVFLMHYHPDYDSHVLYREHLNWDRHHGQPFKAFIKPHTNDRSPNRRLRIGYVSPDFKNHVVTWNFLPLLRQHDHQQFEIFCYAKVKKPDEFSDQIRASADAWRNIIDLNEDQAAKLIRDDQIDILVDLSLHSGDHVLSIFARKPAPLQLTYLGYCSTSGLEAMDYRFSDPYFDPPDSDLSCYREKTIRLPQTYWCYQPGGPTPDVSPLPALTAGHITFGCLNNFAKASVPAMDLWIKILQQVPNSRLLLHSKLGAHRQRMLDYFAAQGIAADRLEFIAAIPWEQYTHLYARIDIALDPFPYNGGITSCDTLWMGVPLISLRGQTAVGRAGSSILSNVGLPELIAGDPAQYVHLAVELANDLPRLTELRRSLRDRVRQSPLMDAPRFTKNVEFAYRQIWQKWCEDHRKS